jgi:hypothetical protein
MRVGNIFIDPLTNERWTWPINHSDETGTAAKSGGQGGLERNYTISAPTSQGIVIRQQAADDPISFSWKGTALTRAQHQSFLYWYAKCKHRSIILEDFSGDVFEVLITAYIPTRKAVAANRNDPTHAPTWVYDFQLDMDVLASISGDYAAEGLP